MKAPINQIWIPISIFSNQIDFNFSIIARKFFLVSGTLYLIISGTMFLILIRYNVPDTKNSFFPMSRTMFLIPHTKNVPDNEFCVAKEQASCSQVDACVRQKCTPTFNSAYPSRQHAKGDINIHTHLPPRPTHKRRQTRR